MLILLLLLICDVLFCGVVFGCDCVWRLFERGGKEEDVYMKGLEGEGWGAEGGGGGGGG